MVISMPTQIYDKHTKKHEKKKLSVNDHTDPEMIKILAKKKVFWWVANRGNKEWLSRQQTS